MEENEPEGRKSAFGKRGSQRSGSILFKAPIHQKELKRLNDIKDKLKQLQSQTSGKEKIEEFDENKKKIILESKDFNEYFMNVSKYVEKLLEEDEN